MAIRGGASWLAPVLVLFSATQSAAEPQGSILAASCFTCHGPGGASPGAIPSIDSLDAATMRARLLAFRTQEAGVDATIMTRIAKGFDEAELTLIVEYLSAEN